MGKRKAPPAADKEEVHHQDHGKQNTPKQPKLSAEASPGFKNKEKVLLLSSRGITHRYVLALISPCLICTHAYPAEHFYVVADRDISCWI